MAPQDSWVKKLEEEIMLNMLPIVKEIKRAKASIVGIFTVIKTFLWRRV